MLIIRNVLDPYSTFGIQAIKQVHKILKAQFPALSDEEINSIPDKLSNSIKYKFQSRLIIAQNEHDVVLGFALLMYDPVNKFSYLDFIAAGKKNTSKGIGGALYQRVREEAKKMSSICLLMECLPDDPELSPDPNIRKQNAKRFAFYENYNALPITGTLYETPIKKGATNPPYLVIDTLNNPLPKGRKIKQFVRAILERKYADICDDSYINKVVASFPDGKISVRPPKYIKKQEVIPLDSKSPDKISLIPNEGHEIHHIRERGYVQSPVRVRVILREIMKLNIIKKVPRKSFSDRHILAVHDADFVKFIKKSCLSIESNKSIYPYVFPIRNQDRKPLDVPLLAGYYCIDTFTPLNKNAYLAARAAVDCVLTGAIEILFSTKIAYALVRPPGHHAERKSFGGFCYFSNIAIAANYLSRYGKVAILDIDYHHGNGQQDIFYKRRDVLTISLHGHPKFAYPYFTGFADEMGEGEGYGYNMNIPLPEHLSPDDYIKAVLKALKKIKKFNPEYLVIALGLDTAKSDPTGSWSLVANDYKTIGEHIGNLCLPTLVVQEGGYRTKTLGINARNFFMGLYSAIYSTQNKDK